MKGTMKFLVLLAILPLAYSCNKFLSETPDLRTEINNKEKAESLVAAAYPGSGYAAFLEPRTDLVEDLSPDSGLSTDRIDTDAFFWVTNDLTGPDTSLSYWSDCYSSIAVANHALRSLDELEAANGISAADAMPIRGEALLCRAYAHFMCVSIWGEAYDPNKDDLGIPYVTEPEDVPLKSYKRNTVKEVYDLIEKDILEGIPLLEQGVSYYTKPLYHFNIGAAYALANRFYLNKGDWEKTLEYGTKAYGGSDPTLVLRNWTSGPVYNSTYYDIVRFYSSVEEPTNLLLTSANSLYARDSSRGRYKLSQRLALSLFGNNPAGSWSIDLYGTDYYQNIPKFEEYFRVTNPVANTGYPYVTYVLLSVDEVFLNNIEAKIMQGKDSEALTDINAFLRKNTVARGFQEVTIDVVRNTYGVAADTFSPFYGAPAGDGLALLNFLMEIRKRIFIHEGMRWFDIKRHHIRITHRDYRGVEYILEKDSPKRLLQIPNIAIARGIEPNP